MGRLLDIAGYKEPGYNNRLPRSQETNLTKETKEGAASVVRCDAADSWEWILERAAILEYETGLRRDMADARAFQMWFERFVGG